MEFDLLFSLPGADACSALLPALALKGLVIFGAAGLISLALKRASAAARHVVWLLAILGVLGLPLISLIVPPLHLPTAPPAHLPTAPPAAVAAPHSAPASHPASVPALPPLAPASYPAPLPAPPQTPRKEPASASNLWPLLLTAVWAVVAFAALARLGLGLFFAGRVARRCPPVTDPVLLARMQRLREAAGIRRSVRLCRGAVAVPMTTGLFRPVVLLPADAGTWPQDRLRAALSHELAHVGRRDWAWHVLAAMVCALHWFNPLAWLAAHRLRAESEGACDDAVLAVGIQPIDYAQHLLEIARQVSMPGAVRPGVAVAMAHRPQIENRLRAILGDGLDRRGLTRRRLLLALALAMFVIFPLAALRTTTQDKSRKLAQDETHWVQPPRQRSPADHDMPAGASWAAYSLKLASLSNLRRIGQAVIMYAQNHGGRLPDADHWVDEIAPTLANGYPDVLLSLMRDPAAPAQSYGYAFNRSLSGVNLASVKYPSEVAMVFESTLGRRNAADTGTSVPSPGRYHGGSHYVFADGQTRLVAAGEKVSFSADYVPTLPAVGPWGAGEFTGRVVYEDGRAAAYVRVGAQILHDAERQLVEKPTGHPTPAGVALHFTPGAVRPSPIQVEQLSWGEDVTGPDGVYHIHGLTSAPYNVAVLPQDPSDDGNDPWVAAAIEGAAAEEGKTVPLHNLVLTVGGFVSGQVTDAAGIPLANFWIGSRGPHRPASGFMDIETRTGPDGHYRLRVAPGSSHIYIASHIDVAAAGRTAQDITVNVAKGETKIANFHLSLQSVRPTSGGYPGGIDSFWIREANKNTPFRPQQ